MALNDSLGSLREQLHSKLITRIDLHKFSQLPSDRLEQELSSVIALLIQESGVALNVQEHRQLVEEIRYEITGLGPLEPLLQDGSVSDILVNGPNQVYVERRGKLELTDVVFSNSSHLMKIIDKIVSHVGRRIDESSPMVDARLADGSRVNVIIPPLALDGPVMSIRRFSVVPLVMQDLVDKHSIAPPLAHLLGAMVKAKMNILISGGTGSGKTTLLNVLSSHIPHDERIVTIEDAAELQLQQPHVVRLETRPPNIEGKGEISQRALVINSLRMRPDRVILGEIRGAEALDMLQAMNTGHEGSMATVHANTPRDALVRLENMATYGGATLTQDAIRHQISSAIHAVIQISRLSDGKRKLLSLQEVTGMEGSIITMQEIFHFVRTGVNQEGAVLGHFKATGVRPKYSERLQSFGLKIPESTFDPSLIYE